MKFSFFFFPSFCCLVDNSCWRQWSWKNFSSSAIWSRKVPGRILCSHSWNRLYGRSFFFFFFLIYRLVFYHVSLWIRVGFRLGKTRVSRKMIYTYFHPSHLISIRQKYFFSERKKMTSPLDFPNLYFRYHRFYQQIFMFLPYACCFACRPIPSFYVTLSRICFGGLSSLLKTILTIINMRLIVDRLQKESMLLLYM